MSAIRRAFRTRAVLVAAWLFASSAIVAVVSFGRAIAIDSLPAASAEPAVFPVSLQGAPRTPSELITEAVASAPFSPSRHAVIVTEPTPYSSGGVAPALELVGTVVDTDSASFVLVTVAGSSGAAKVVRVGESIAGYRLRSIGQASAVFVRTADSERVELRVPSARNR